MAAVQPAGPDPMMTTRSGMVTPLQHRAREAYAPSLNGAVGPAHRHLYLPGPRPPARWGSREASTKPAPRCPARPSRRGSRLYSYRATIVGWRTTGSTPRRAAVLA